MKLRNKKTGEIGNLEYHGLEDERIWVWIDNTSKPEYRYDSLAELNEEWEDYEEPKVYYYIDDTGVIQIDQLLASEINMRKSIGNYFNTREEAEKAVEKLKAWKRLGNKGFRFTGYDTNYGHHRASFVFEKEAWATETEPDLDLVFGGEE